MHVSEASTVTFEGNSTVTFTNNIGGGNSGTIYIILSAAKFEENSTVKFINNRAYQSDANNGGAMYAYAFSFITFEGNSSVTFDNGGGVYVSYLSFLTFKGTSKITYNNGAVYVNEAPIVTFEKTLK